MEHLKIHFEEQIIVPCFCKNTPSKMCDKKYRSLVSFRSHIPKVHRIPDSVALNSGVITASPSQHRDIGDSGRSSSACESNNCARMEVDVPEDAFDGPENMCSVSNDSPLRSAAHFYLKLETELHVPSSTVQSIATEIQELTNFSKVQLKKKLESCLGGYNLDINSIELVVESVCKDPTLFLYHKELSSNHLRRKFYKENFSFAIPLKKSFDPAVDPNDKNCKQFFYYAPILDTLKIMLKDKRCFEQYLNPVARQFDIVEDFMDGSSFQSNKFFLDHPDALAVNLFQDALEIVNPIGAAKSCHKILAMYMTLGNCRPWWRFRKNNIQLVALYKVKDFDHSQFYKPVVEDLKKLETEGIEIAENKTVVGTVAHISGDNAGSNEFGGCVCNFSRS